MVFEFAQGPQHCWFFAIGKLSLKGLLGIEKLSRSYDTSDLELNISELCGDYESLRASNKEGTRINPLPMPRDSRPYS